MKAHLHALPTSMRVRSRKTPITHPHAQIRQSHLENRHHLIFAVIQFVHLPLLLIQIFKSSEEFTLLPRVLLTLRKFFVTGVVGFPLPLLVLLDLGIGSGFLLFDRFAQEPVLATLPLHLHLMIIEDTIERICSFFRLLTAFPVQFACVVHTFSGSIRPPLHVLQSSLERFPLFRHFGVGNRGFSIAMIGIDAKRNEPISNGILLGRPTSSVGVHQFHCICFYRCRHNGNQFRLCWLCWQRRGLPALV